MTSLIYHLRRKIVTFFMRARVSRRISSQSVNGLCWGLDFLVDSEFNDAQMFCRASGLGGIGRAEVHGRLINFPPTKVGRCWGTVVVKGKCGTYVLQRNSTDGGRLLSLSCRNSFRMIFERGFFFCKVASSHSAFSCNPSLAYNTPSARCDEYL